MKIFIFEFQVEKKATDGSGRAGDPSCAPRWDGAFTVSAPGLLTLHSRLENVVNLVVKQHIHAIPQCSLFLLHLREEAVDFV